MDTVFELYCPLMRAVPFAIASIRPFVTLATLELLVVQTAASPTFVFAPVSNSAVTVTVLTSPGFKFSFFSLAVNFFNFGTTFTLTVASLPW